MKFRMCGQLIVIFCSLAYAQIVSESSVEKCTSKEDLADAECMGAVGSTSILQKTADGVQTPVGWEEKNVFADQTTWQKNKPTTWDGSLPQERVATQAQNQKSDAGFEENENHVKGQGLQQATEGFSALQRDVHQRKAVVVQEAPNTSKDEEIDNWQMQNTEKVIGDELLPAETKAGPHFHAMEQWQDLTKYELFDVDAMANGTLTVSQQDWLQAFSKLDVNNDGKIDAVDLDGKEAQCANKQLNATQENYREAVGMLAEYTPEFSDFMFRHESAVIFLAETNKSAPEDAPVPTKEAMALFQTNSKTVALTEWTACGWALAGFVSNAVMWGLEMMGIYIWGKVSSPVNLFSRIQHQYTEWFQDEMKSIWQSIKNRHFWQAAKSVWNVLKKTFSMGILKQMVRNALSNMGWWDWIRSAVSFLARLLATMASAGAALIAHMVHQIVNAWILVQKGKQTCVACAINCGDGGWTVGQIVWSAHPSKCFDVNGGQVKDGVNLQLWDGNQKFTVPRGRSDRIVWSANPNKCLDVVDGGTWNGNNIVIWECSDNNPNQQWTVPSTGTGPIQWAAHPHKCIDVASGHTHNGVNLQIWDCEPTPNQQWKIP